MSITCRVRVLTLRAVVSILMLEFGTMIGWGNRQ